MGSERSDGIVFTDKSGTPEVIFNYLTWVEVVKAIIVRYADTTPEVAAELVSQSPITSVLPTSSMSVLSLSHDLEYHWAMIIKYGPMYWLRGISAHYPEGYLEWDTKYRSENGLAAESFVWMDSMSRGKHEQ